MDNNLHLSQKYKLDLAPKIYHFERRFLIREGIQKLLER